MILPPIINVYFFFFFNDTATTEIYTLSLHDALPISSHHQKHEADHGQRSDRQHNHQIEQPHRVPDAVNSRDQPADDGDGQTGHQPLDGTSEVQSEDQLGFVDRRYQVALVQAARLVVNKHDPAADHGHHEDGNRDRAREQILDVLDVGIDLDDLQIYGAGQARLGDRRVQVGLNLLDAFEQAAGNEIVGVVFDECDARAILVQNAARVAVRNVHDGADETRAQVQDGVGKRIVFDGVERLRAGGNGIEAFANNARLAGAVLIHQGDGDALDLSAKRVAQHDELHQRKDHGADHQRGAA